VSEELTRLADWVAPLLAGLSVPRRRAAMVQVATYMRRSNAQRIAEQRNPDGSGYEPRKPRRGPPFSQSAGAVHASRWSTSGACATRSTGAARAARS
jgi:phage virion morphogenesis protein